MRIERSTADCIMNSKAEFHQEPLIRVVPVAGLQEDQEAGKDQRQDVRGGEEEQAEAEIAESRVSPLGRAHLGPQGFLQHRLKGLPLFHFDFQYISNSSLLSFC